MGYTQLNGPFDLHVWGTSVNNPTTLPSRPGEWVTHMAGHKNMVLCLEKGGKAVNYTFCAIILALRPPALQIHTSWVKLQETFLFAKSIDDPVRPVCFLKRCRVLFLLLPILNCLNGDRRLDCKSILPGPKSRFTCHIWDLPLSISPTLLILYIKISTISSSKLSHLSHRLSVCHTSDIPLALSPWPTLCVKSLFVKGFFDLFLLLF